VEGILLSDSGGTRWTEKDNESSTSECLKCLLGYLLHRLRVVLDDGTGWCISDDGLQQQ
jgi:hypothetical protein